MNSKSALRSSVLPSPDSSRPEMVRVDFCEHPRGVGIEELPAAEVEGRVEQVGLFEGLALRRAVGPPRYIGQGIRAVFGQQLHLVVVLPVLVIDGGGIPFQRVGAVLPYLHHHRLVENLGRQVFVASGQDALAGAACPCCRSPAWASWRWWPWGRRTRRFWAWSYSLSEAAVKPSHWLIKRYSQRVLLSCVDIAIEAVRNPNPSFPRKRESKLPLPHSPVNPESPRTDLVLIMTVAT